MTTPALADLFSALTRAQVEAKMLVIAEGLEFVVSAWDPLGAARGLFSIFAQQLANFTETTTLIARSGLLDFAANTDGTINPWLTVLADSLYDVQREEATFAKSETYVLTNTTASPITVDVGDLTIAITSGTNEGALFQNTTGGVIAGFGTMTITVIALVVGSSSSATADTITTMVSGFAGLTGTNPDPALARDDELDPPLVKRCKAKLGALSPDGPQGAYEYFATTAVHADGTPVDVNRVSVSPYSPTGQVTVYVASESGVVPGTVGDLSTDLGLVAENIFQNATPMAVTPTIASATGLNVTIAATVYMRASNTLASATVKEKVVEALAAYFETVPIGGTDIGGGGFLFLDAVIGEIYQAIPGQIAQVIITSPGADVAMTAAQVAVLQSTTADITVTQL